MHVKSNHTFRCHSEYLNKKIEIQRPYLFHFKAFGMIDLHYDMRICQKIYYRFTMTVYVKFMVRFNVHQTLYQRKNCEVKLENKALFKYVCLTARVFIALAIKIYIMITSLLYYEFKG